MMVADKIETDAQVLRLERELRDAEREAEDLRFELEDERSNRHGIEREEATRLVAVAVETLTDVERGVFTLAEAKVRIEGLDS